MSDHPHTPNKAADAATNTADTADLVRRIRNHFMFWQMPTMDEAADEIERLSAIVTDLRSTVAAVTDHVRASLASPAACDIERGYDDARLDILDILDIIRPEDNR